jgi:hypothetical protein
MPPAILHEPITQYDPTVYPPGFNDLIGQARAIFDQMPAGDGWDQHPDLSAQIAVIMGKLYAFSLGTVTPDDQTNISYNDQIAKLQAAVSHDANKDIPFGPYTVDYDNFIHYHVPAQDTHAAKLWFSVSDTTRPVKISQADLNQKFGGDLQKWALATASYFASDPPFFSETRDLYFDPSIDDSYGGPNNPDGIERNGVYRLESHQFTRYTPPVHKKSFLSTVFNPVSLIISAAAIVTLQPELLGLEVVGDAGADIGASAIVDAGTTAAEDVTTSAVTNFVPSAVVEDYGGVIGTDTTFGQNVIQGSQGLENYSNVLGTDTSFGQGTIQASQAATPAYTAADIVPPPSLTSQIGQKVAEKALTSAASKGVNTVIQDFSKTTAPTTMVAQNASLLGDFFAVPPPSMTPPSMLPNQLPNQGTPGSSSVLLVAGGFAALLVLKLAIKHLARPQHG